MFCFVLIKNLSKGINMNQKKRRKHTQSGKTHTQSGKKYTQSGKKQVHI